MPPGLDLKGKTFGPLRIVSRWGAISTNVAWIYFCRACGHVGHRLGTKLKAGDVKCPNCLCVQSNMENGGWAYSRPDPEAIEKKMRDAQPDPKPRIWAKRKRAFGPCQTRSHKRGRQFLCQMEADTVRKIQAAPGLWVHVLLCHGHQHVWDEALEWGGGEMVRERICEKEH